MAGEPVFLDTGCLIALVRRRDALHAAATTVMQDLAKERCPLVTSQWVLAEFLGSVADPSVRGRGVALVRSLQGSPGTSIIAASEFGAVLDYYAARSDKAWSFVDCSSILTCQARGIRRVFTHDAHFAQAGLDLLLR